MISKGLQWRPVPKPLRSEYDVECNSSLIVNDCLPFMTMLAQEDSGRLTRWRIAGSGPFRAPWKCRWVTKAARNVEIVIMNILKQKNAPVLGGWVKERQ